MPTANPYRLGELSKLYWIPNSDFDHDDGDGVVLDDGAWQELCIVSATKNQAITTRQIKDRCSAKKIKSAYGRSEISISVTLNSFRLTAAQRKALENVIANQQQVSILMLTDERTNTETYGIVGTFIIESHDEEQPEEGNNTETITLKESALALHDARAIYGSAFA